MRREHPEATLERAAQRRRELQDRAREWLKATRTSIRRPAAAGAVISQVPDTRFERLEQLGRLRDAGVLSAAEFEQEKRLLLQSDGVTPAVG